MSLWCRFACQRRFLTNLLRHRKNVGICTRIYFLTSSAFPFSHFQLPHRSEKATIIKIPFAIKCQNITLHTYSTHPPVYFVTVIKRRNKNHGLHDRFRNILPLNMSRHFRHNHFHDDQITDPPFCLGKVYSVRLT